MRLVLENSAKVRLLLLVVKEWSGIWNIFIFICLFLSVFVFVFFSPVFATNFRVKAAMKNSVLLSWEIRDKNPSQPFTVSLPTVFTCKYSQIKWVISLTSLRDIRAGFIQRFEGKSKENAITQSTLTHIANSAPFSDMETFAGYLWFYLVVKNFSSICYITDRDLELHQAP